MADFRAQLTPRAPHVTGHIDGYALRFGHEPVVSGPFIEDAMEAFKAAKEGLAMLAACLANAPANRGANDGL